MRTTKEASQNKNVAVANQCSSKEGGGTSCTGILCNAKACSRPVGAQAEGPKPFTPFPLKEHLTTFAASNTKYIYSMFY